jgi:hypothetical protein
VTPQGDLLVACHSGPPDWGTGPAGEGRLFKIHYTGRDLPQPVQSWAAGPDEFRIAFDRPLQVADWAHAKDQVKIEAGAFVSAGDRFEVVRPGYQAVRDQMATPRRWIDVLELTFTEDRRTLVLRVPRQTEMAHYAITLPLPETWKIPGGITQYPQMDVALTLNGLAATVRTPDGKERRSVLPHPALSASAAFTAGSTEHESFLQATAIKDATLTLGGAVDVSNPFVPAVQPGSKLDWDIAADSFASEPFAVRTDYAEENQVEFQDAADRRLRALKPLAIKNPAWGTNGLFVAKATLQHSLSTTRVFVPWATEKLVNALPVRSQTPAPM